MKNKPTAITAARNVHPVISKAPAAEQPADASDLKGFAAAWNRFWLTPADPAGLHALRILSGLLFLFWLLPFAGSVEAFFSFNGWFDRQALREHTEEMRRFPPEQRPHMGWSVLYLVAEDTNLVQVVYWSALAVLVLFTLGLAPRLTALATWILIVSFVTFLALPVGHSEEDVFLIPAFYLMIGYLLLGQFSRKQNVWQRILGDSVIPFTGKKAESEPASYAANVATRLFQANFALLVVVGCLYKLQIGDWWSGVAFWYPLHNPFETTAAQIHAAARYGPSLLFAYSLTQYVFLAWQLTFPVWAWRPGLFCRSLLIGGGLVGFIGAIWIYQLPALGAFYVVGSLAFVTPAEWRWCAAQLRSLVPAKAAAIAPPKSLESRGQVAVRA